MYNLIEGERSKAIKRLTSTASPTRPSGQRAISDVTKADTPEARGLKRAKAAIDHLTRNDVSEFHSYGPQVPRPVERVASALMVLLQGAALPWASARRTMANGDRFLRLVYDFDPDSVRSSQLRMLQPFLDDPDFRPHVIRDVSRPAASFCAWILGMVMTRKWRSGSGDEASDPLLPKPTEAQASGETAEGAANEDGGRPGETFAEKLERRRKEQMLRKERDENNLGMFAVAGLEHRSSSYSDVRRHMASKSPKKKAADTGTHRDESFSTDH